MLIIIREDIIPVIPSDSLDVYKTVEPTNIADERMLPESKILDFGLAFKNWSDLFSSINFLSSGAIVCYNYKIVGVTVYSWTLKLAIFDWHILAGWRQQKDS